MSTSTEEKDITMEPRRSDSIWKVLVLLLLVVVGFQAYMMFRIDQRLGGDRNVEDSAPPPAQQPDATVSLPPVQLPANLMGAQMPQPQVAPPQQAPQPQANQQNRLGLRPLPNMSQQGGYAQPQSQPQIQIQIPQFGGGFGGGFGDPMREMEQMRKMMEQMMAQHGFGSMSMGPSMGSRFSQGGGFGSGMNANVKVDKDNNYLIQMRIPGLSKDGIDARINGNMLTVNATQKSQNQRQMGNGYSNSQSYSSFQTSMSLPGPVQADKMKIEYKDDILTVKVPKA